MKYSELKIGDIFSIPSMPQWGLMMRSYYRDGKVQIDVSLTGNRWAHDIERFDDDEDVVLHEDISSVIKMVGSYTRSINRKNEWI